MKELSTGSNRSSRIFSRSALSRPAGFGLIGALALALTGPALAQDVNGTWLTEDGDARIAITECEPGAKELCGTIVALKTPTDPKTGKAPTDKNNPDEAKRTLPIVGVQIVRGMKYSKPGTWKGEVYNPNDGRIYTANLISKGADKVRLEGCMFFICSGETWTKTEPLVTDLAPRKPATGTASKPATALSKPTTTGSTR